MSDTNLEQTFQQAKDTYNRLRRAEKVKIANFLDKHEFTILTLAGVPAVDLTSCGQGRSDYKGDYDLTNWQYIYTQKGQTYYYISLQCFDKDEGSGNRHILVDRIGVYSCDKNTKGKFPNAYSDMQNTHIDLPMNDTKLQQLLDFLNQLQ